MTDEAEKKPEDELAALKARVAELEAKAKPPEPFVPAPYQRYDPTEGMCMPPSALREMLAAEPRGFMKGVIGDNRAPQGRPGAIPSSQTVSNAPPAGGGSGWVEPRPLSNPPGTNWVDAIVEADTARQRAELARKLKE
jgi:hypothetical protein